MKLVVALLSVVIAWQLVNATSGHDIAIEKLPASGSVVSKLTRAIEYEVEIKKLPAFSIDVAAIGVSPRVAGR